MQPEHSYTPDVQEADSRPFYKKPGVYLKTLLVIAGVLFAVVLMAVLSLRWINPPTTSFMLQQNWTELGVERYNLRTTWVEGERIPEHLAWAVIASEDQMFREHWGFDIESIREAWEDRREGVRSRGASSISQQVVKNLFLWPGESYLRKGIEAGITVLMELMLPKDRIMELYLNIAEFAPGVFGVGKASEELFSIPPEELEPDMSARLAAVLPSPKRMRVEPPSPFTNERSQWILQQMTQLSGIQYVPEETLPDTLQEPGFDFSDTDSLISRPVDRQTLSGADDTLQSPALPGSRDTLPSPGIPDSLQ